MVHIYIQKIEYAPRAQYQKVQRRQITLSIAYSIYSIGTIVWIIDVIVQIVPHKGRFFFSVYRFTIHSCFHSIRFCLAYTFGYIIVFLWLKTSVEKSPALALLRPAEKSWKDIRNIQRKVQEESKAILRKTYKDLKVMSF